MVLIIAEKPQLGRLIADAIDGKEKTENGTIRKGDYCIIWAFGHLLTLKEPEDFDPALAKWDLKTLPIYRAKWEMKPKPDTGKGVSAIARLKQIRKLIDSEECEYVIHAGDPDDEGQLLIDEILDYCKCIKPVMRMATGDTTVPALKRALKNLQPNAGFENDGRAAYGRTVSDMVFGINMSRFFSLKNNAHITVGRVQTPTLWMVVNRDMKIEKHEKQQYYTISADLKIGDHIVTCRYEPDKDDPNLLGGRITDESYAKSRMEMLKDEQFDVINISSRITETEPPLPVDLNALQEYCGKRYGYTPAQVMEYTQSLRGMNAITYNRSECRYLSANHLNEAPETISTVIRNIKFSPPNIDSGIVSRAFDSSKVTTHFAIIPQNEEVDISQMTIPERNVYMSIAKFYFIQFMPKAKKRLARLTVHLPDGGRLTATATEILEKGYLALFSKDKVEEPDETDCPGLLELADGRYFGSVTDIRLEQKETKPPARYTQTSLNKDMTRISKYVDNEEIRRLLIEKDKNKEGDNGSIGTVATRAGIITNLINRGFLTEEGKHLVSTPLGRELIRILPEQAKHPDLTARWWVIQEDIRNGDATYEKLTSNVLDTVYGILEGSYDTINPEVLPKTRNDREELGICPKCGKPVIEGKQGFGCSGWKDGCRFTIWKKPKMHLMEDIVFTKENARALLAGKTVKKDKLKTRDNKWFTAKIRLKDDKNSPYADFELVFDNKRKG